MSERIRLIQRVVIAISAVALGASSAQGQWHYYYFKEKRPLKLDVDRVALLRPAARLQLAAPSRAAGFSPREPSSAPESAAQFGLDENDVKPWPIKGWSLVGTTARMRTPVAVQEIVGQISNQKAADFVSPVFVGNDGGPLVVTPDILVGFKRDIDPARAEAILAELKAGTVLDRNWANMKRAYRLRSHSRNGFDVLETANRLAERPEVKFAEPDMIFTGRHALIPNDPGFPSCWGLHNTGQFGGIVDMDMDAPEAWEITTGDPSIIVVIIDTGVQQDHPDINQMPGVDTTSQSGDGGPVNACDNHGTAVAGCVSGIINNNLGTVGVAPDCVSASARTFISTLDCSGGWNAQASWTVDTLTWAESIGARVTNNSNYYGFQSSAIAQKYEDTRFAGMIHFSSANNDGIPQITYPANLPTVNAVAALDPDGTLTFFSNWGAGLAFSAPGIDVYTTDRTGSAGWTGGDYVFAWGTSFASPYSAGVAALALSVNPGLNAFDVEQVMQKSSVDLGDPGYDTTFGWGFVNANEAVLLAAPPVEPCELQELTAAGGAAGNRFPAPVSISGDVAILGAGLDDCAAGADCGSAYIFRSEGGVWAEKAKVTASDASAGARFGWSAAISGDLAVVGAYARDTVYIYRFNGTTWVEEAKLTGPGGRFGWSVSVDGNVAVIGAYFANSAYFYRFNGSTWVQEGAVSVPSSFYFGHWVSISGDLAVVGAVFESCAGGAHCGAAYIYRFNESAWVQEQKLTASDARADDNFGYSVSISGNVAAIGAHGDDCPGGGDCGAAYIYRFNGSAWVEEVKLTPSERAVADGFGLPVSISGEVILAGASGHDCQAGPDCGAAYLFRHTSNTWVEDAKIVPDDVQVGDEFGAAASISGSLAVIGAIGDDAAGPDFGSAYIFAVGGDCNRSGVPDICDIRDGTSPDNNGNGIPDECDCIPSSTPGTPTVLGEVTLGAGQNTATTGGSVKNRFISVTGGDPGRNQALRVKVVSLPATYDVWNGMDLWVSSLSEVCENGGVPGGPPCPPGGAPGLPKDTFWAAKLSCDWADALFMDWTTLDLPVHIYNEVIVPSNRTGGKDEDAVYELAFADDTCALKDALKDDASYSAVPLVVVQPKWGDVLDACNKDPCSAPQGVTNIGDVTGVLAKFQNLPGAPIKARTDLVGLPGNEGELDRVISIVDVTWDLDAFIGGKYEFAPGDPCDGS
jgi:subtilisin family serine protease